MAVAPHEVDLRIEPRVVELDQDFAVFDPTITIAIPWGDLPGFSTEHVLSSPETSLLFRFSIFSIFRYDFAEREEIEARSSSAAYNPPIGLSAISTLTLGRMGLRRIDRWCRDIFFQLTGPDFPNDFESPIRLSRKDRVKQLLTIDDFKPGQVADYLSMNTDFLAQLRGKFVKHSPAK